MPKSHKNIFYKRDLSRAFKRYSKFPVIAILGPRQAGKTVLAKHYFSKHTYINLENPEWRASAKEDPNRFLQEHGGNHGLIIDEFQYVPELLSYIQVLVDEQNKPGYFILTGSQNFLVNEAISQSLAGRIGILTLLPLSLHELAQSHLLDSIDQTLLQGSYPRLYEAEIEAQDFYPSYIHTYLERDVRTLAGVHDLLIFQKFMRLCAARIGQQLNIADIAMHLGMEQKKVKEWIAVLEASYILFLLRPHFQNFNKRLTKTPKLYFYDTGLACSLLEIKTKETLALSPYRGNLFESLIISDFMKQFYHSGKQPSLYFWRDQNGRIEVDCIIDRGDTLIPVEIKSGETITSDFFSSLKRWSEIADTQKNPTIIYGGDKKQSRQQATVLGWKQAKHFIDSLMQAPVLQVRK